MIFYMYKPPGGLAYTMISFFDMCMIYIYIYIPYIDLLNDIFVSIVIVRIGAEHPWPGTHATGQAAQ